MVLAHTTLIAHHADPAASVAFWRDRVGCSVRGNQPPVTDATSDSPDWSSAPRGCAAFSSMAGPTVAPDPPETGRSPNLLLRAPTGHAVEGAGNLESGQ